MFYVCSFEIVFCFFCLQAPTMIYQEQSSMFLSPLVSLLSPLGTLLRSRHLLFSVLHPVLYNVPLFLASPLSHALYLFFLAPNALEQDFFQNLEGMALLLYI